ncbi:MAG: DUF6285 domain-containing protein [Acidimicrobiales bacterium]
MSRGGSVRDRPSAAELLASLAETLAERVVPVIEGALRHEVRVAANLCRILEREALIGDEVDTRARAALLDLLDRPGTEAGSMATAELLHDLDRSLADADESGLARAWTTLYEIARARAEIVRPGYTAPARGTEPA